MAIEHALQCQGLGLAIRRGGTVDLLVVSHARSLTYHSMAAGIIPTRNNRLANELTPGRLSIAQQRNVAGTNARNDMRAAACGVLLLLLLLPHLAASAAAEIPDWAATLSR